AGRSETNGTACIAFPAGRVPLLASVALAALFAGPGPAGAVDVASEAELRAAIYAANTGGDPAINITGNITLTRSLPMITTSVAIAGNGHTIDANNSGRVFFIQAGSASISNVTVENARAQGGNGGDSWTGGGGGGGLGAGAAIFVNSGASASVSDVTIGDAAAIGGAGGRDTFGEIAAITGGGGGGGGLGGDGGGSFLHAAGGGGGYEGGGGGG